MVRVAIPLLVLAFLTPNPGSAAIGLSPDEAARLAQDAMASAGITDATPVAPSRALPPCDGSVTAAPRQAGDWSTVTLSCSTPHWTRSLRSRAGAPPPPRDGNATPVAPLRPVLGLARPLAKGAVIGPDDIAVINVSDLGPDQGFADPAQLLGRKLRQSLGANKTILARHLEPEYLVESGAPVLILSEGGAVSVSSQGRAEANAGMGELVSITNLSSGRKIMARVAGKDIVTVTLKPFESLP